MEGIIDILEEFCVISYVMYSGYDGKIVVLI